MESIAYQEFNDAQDSDVWRQKEKRDSIQLDFNLSGRIEWNFNLVYLMDTKEHVGYHKSLTQAKLALLDQHLYLPINALTL